MERPAYRCLNCGKVADEGHDLWCGSYLERECGVILHRQPLTTEIYGKVFFLAHVGGEVLKSYFGIAFEEVFSVHEQRSDVVTIVGDVATISQFHAR